MDQIKEANQAWKERIKKLSDTFYRKEETILIHLKFNIKFIKEKHSFANQNDGELVKNILQNVILSYKTEIDPAIEKMCLYANLDLINSILEIAKKGVNIRSEKLKSLVIDEANNLGNNIYNGILIEYIKNNFIAKLDKIIEQIKLLYEQFEDEMRSVSEKIDTYFNKMTNNTLDVWGDNFNIANVLWFDLKLKNKEKRLYEAELNKELKMKNIQLTTFENMKRYTAHVEKLTRRTILIVSGSSHKAVFE